MKKDKDSQEIKDLLDQRIAQAQELGIRGTPGFIIAGELFPGYIPAAQMKDVIAKARES
jgi:protein-disulfide isomerase